MVTADGNVVVVVDVVVVDEVVVVAPTTVVGGIVVGGTVVADGAARTSAGDPKPRRHATNAKESNVRRMTATLATRSAHEMAPAKRY